MESNRFADEQLNTDIEETYEAVPAQADETPVEEPKRKFGRRDKAVSGDSSAKSGELDLAKMKKKDLLEIMLAQSKEIDELKAKVADLEAQLANREFEFSKIGSIAEASLAVTDIFKEAEEAARIYLENIRRSYEKRSKEQGSK